VNKIKVTLPALLLALLVSAVPTMADDSVRAPELPAEVCDQVQAPAGTMVSAHFYALGVQIYRWNGTGWSFVAPDATLFSDAGYNGEVGIHYAGPTWEAVDGSKVTAAVINKCSPYPGAIPWLLLGANSQGNGRFAGVTHIQRVNTIGGTAPAEAGAYVGAEARVPYTAEYYFYRLAQ
jgi:FtsP/CotA-like multicopper oxidase with cupredoxin domain